MPVPSAFRPSGAARSLLEIAAPTKVVFRATSNWKPPSPAFRPACSLADRKSLFIRPWATWPDTELLQ
ncbi:hypothetical protein [Achromobacter ruhlandii]|uniref:hypothetical protein n=1 Tax=Achromobacter ruhlandii TaxID=72557 RepID=UPI0015825BB3|nr:hypothetical protein [Achromobacter ruhlandii]